MPMTEETITIGGTFAEEALLADDSENYYGAGPYQLGRYNVNLSMTEETITAQ